VVSLLSGESGLVLELRHVRLRCGSWSSEYLPQKHGEAKGWAIRPTDGRTHHLRGDPLDSEPREPTTTSWNCAAIITAQHLLLLCLSRLRQSRAGSAPSWRERSLP